jgi:hypothetical protein
MIQEQQQAPWIRASMIHPAQTKPSAMSSLHRPASTAPGGREKTYFEQQREELIGEIAMVSKQGNNT